MARPIKVGLDYFPHNCPTPQTIELIETEFGLVGYAIVYKLYEKIYFEKGYFCEWNRDVALMFAKRNGVGVNVVSEIIKAAFRRDIFNKELYEKYSILTSAEIQTRYIEATVKRKEVNFLKEYLLVNHTHFLNNSVINSINGDINSINSANNQQSKVNKSKVNKSKVCSPSKYSIPCLNGSFEVTEDFYNTLTHTYPHTDIKKSLEKLINYLKSHKLKFINQMEGYIEMWLSRDAENGINGINIIDKYESTYDIEEYEKYDIFDE